MFLGAAWLVIASKARSRSCMLVALQDSSCEVLFMLMSFYRWQCSLNVSRTDIGFPQLQIIKMMAPNELVRNLMLGIFACHEDEKDPFS